MNKLITLLSAKLFSKKVGKDSEGNEYFIKNNNDKLEKRIVIFKKEVEASRVPAEWQAWLTGTTNIVPSKIKKHVWQKEHQPNQTGTTEEYNPNSNNTDIKTKNLNNQFSSWSPNLRKKKNDFKN